MCGGYAERRLSELLRSNFGGCSRTSPVLLYDMYFCIFVSNYFFVAFGARCVLVKLLSVTCFVCRHIRPQLLLLLLHNNHNVARGGKMWPVAVQRPSSPHT
jgi:hypothetical protein